MVQQRVVLNHSVKTLKGSFNHVLRRIQMIKKENTTEP